MYYWDFKGEGILIKMVTNDVSTSEFLRIFFKAKSKQWADAWKFLPTVKA